MEHKTSDDTCTVAFDIMHFIALQIYQLSIFTARLWLHVITAQ